MFLAGTVEHFVSIIIAYGISYLSHFNTLFQVTQKGGLVLLILRFLNRFNITAPGHMLNELNSFILPLSAHRPKHETPEGVFYRLTFERTFYNPQEFIF